MNNLDLNTNTSTFLYPYTYEFKHNSGIINIKDLIIQVAQDSFVLGYMFRDSNQEYINTIKQDSTITIIMEMNKMKEEITLILNRLNEIDDKNDKKITELGKEVRDDIKQISEKINGINGRLIGIETTMGNINKRTEFKRLGILYPAIIAVLVWIADNISQIIGYFQ